MCICYPPFVPLRFPPCKDLCTSISVNENFPTRKKTDKVLRYPAAANFKSMFYANYTQINGLMWTAPPHPPDLALFRYRSNARLIRSQRAGVGKSLQRNNLVEHLRVNLDIRSGEDLTIPIYKTIDTDAIINKLTIVLGEFLLRLESLSSQLLTWDHLLCTALLDNNEPICVSLSHWRKNSQKRSLLTCTEFSKLICLVTIRDLLVN